MLVPTMKSTVTAPSRTKTPCSSSKPCTSSEGEPLFARSTPAALPASTPSPPAVRTAAPASGGVKAAIAAAAISVLIVAPLRSGLRSGSPPVSCAGIAAGSGQAASPPLRDRVGARGVRDRAVPVALPEQQHVAGGERAPEL